MGRENRWIRNNGPTGPLLGADERPEHSPFLPSWEGVRYARCMRKFERKSMLLNYDSLSCLRTDL